MKKLNELQKVMQTKIKGTVSNGKPLVSPTTAGAAARWLRKRK